MSTETMLRTTTTSMTLLCAAAAAHAASSSGARPRPAWITPTPRRPPSCAAYAHAGGAPRSASIRTSLARAGKARVAAFGGRGGGGGATSRGGSSSSSALRVSLSSPPAGPSSTLGDSEDGGPKAKNAPTARSVALRSLASRRDFSVRNLEADPLFLDLDPRDRAYAKNLVATTERRMGQLDAVLGRCADRYPPKGATTATDDDAKGGKKAKGGGATTHGDLVQAALRVGAAQLLFLDTPPYAAVKETIDALRSEGNKVRTRGKRALPESMIKFTNAVLRRVQREGVNLLEGTKATDNVAPWLVQEWTKSWGKDNTEKICERMMLEPRIDLTPNLSPELTQAERAVDLEELRQALSGDGDEDGDDAGSDDEVGGEAELLPQGSIRAGRDASGAVSSWWGYDEGWWWVQDVSSTLPALALRSALTGGAAGGGASSSIAAGADSGDASTGADAEASVEDYAKRTVAELKEMCRARSLPVSGTKAALIERLQTSLDTSAREEDPAAAEKSGDVPDVSTMHVVDMCAAPGGKTAQLLSMGFGRVTAVESNARRCRRLRENLDRLGFAEGEGDDEEEGSRCEIVVAEGQEYRPDGEKPAGVLLDVPCSATGTGTRRPDVLRRSSDLGDLPATQMSLARHVADEVLGKGGVLVYATCSLLEREGEDVVDALLKRGRDGKGAEMEVLPFRDGEVPGFDEAICPQKGWMRVLPGTLGGPMGECDGFFVARLIKR